MKYVYVDILFFLNFFIDLSLLIFTAIYNKQEINKFRIVIAACIGAIYGSIWVIVYEHIIYSILGKFVFSFILLSLAFSWKNLRCFINNIYVFYVINILAAGAVITIQMLIMSQRQLYSKWITFGEDTVWMLEVSITALIFGIPLTIILVRNMYYHYKKQSWKKSWIFNCKIIYKNNEVSFKGLVDTGNQLKEPITNRPISIIEHNIVKNIMPAIVNTIYANSSFNIAYYHELLNKYSSLNSFTIINYRGMGSGQQYLLAFKPDLITISTEEGDINYNNGLIAITTQVLSGINDFNAIIHPNLLEGTKCKKEEMVYESFINENPATNEN
jgi:stage II sporulation protein GA (sporulation sigma-E factor processing peptidase)